jgi:hypothetical protein
VGEELDAVAHGKQVYLEGEHARFSRGLGWVDGEEDVVSVVDAGVEGCEVQTVMLGKRLGECAGLLIPRRDIAFDE